MPSDRCGPRDAPQPFVPASRPNMSNSNVLCFFVLCVCVHLCMYMCIHMCGCLRRTEADVGLTVSLVTLCVETGISLETGGRPFG